MAFELPVIMTCCYIPLYLCLRPSYLLHYLLLFLDFASGRLMYLVVQYGAGFRQNRMLFIIFFCSLAIGR